MFFLVVLVRTDEPLCTCFSRRDNEFIMRIHTNILVSQWSSILMQVVGTRRVKVEDAFCVFVLTPCNFRSLWWLVSFSTFYGSICSLKVPSFSGENTCRTRSRERSVSKMSALLARYPCLLRKRRLFGRRVFR